MNFGKLTEGKAREYFFKGRLLDAVKFPPSVFLDIVVPLYNRLNGDFVIGSLQVDYTDNLSALHESDSEEVCHG